MIVFENLEVLLICFMIEKNDVENCGQPYPMKPHQRGADARNGLPYEADIQSLGQPHVCIRVVWLCVKREIWTSPAMARPIIEISKTSTHHAHTWTLVK